MRKFELFNAIFYIDSSIRFEIFLFINASQMRTLLRATFIFKHLGHNFVVLLGCNRISGTRRVFPDIYITSENLLPHISILGCMTLRYKYFCYTHIWHPCYKFLVWHFWGQEVKVFFEQKHKSLNTIISHNITRFSPYI